MPYILIGLAGACGAILRYLVGLILFTHTIFPFSTLIINLIGSFILAWLTTELLKKLKMPSMFATALSTGFVGSFTTFSTLSVETIQLFRNDHVFLGVIYVLLSIVGGLLMSSLGYKVTEEVKK